ncbi:MAG TPA: ribosome maturation factor RimM [Bryobacteraceae bacterium]|nr:ribosome maturation factor RimM [Bryobacteraceae bacterium]
MQANQWVALAALRRARGIKGEILAENLGSDPDRFQPGLKVTLLPSLESKQGKHAELESSWVHQGLLVLKFVGFDSRTEAEDLQGWFVCVPEDERPELDEGQVYLSDLVGCEVIASDGRSIGVVTGWQDIGGPVLLEVGDNLLIPFVEQICREVDTEGRRIKVELPEGLEDLNRK